MVHVKIGGGWTLSDLARFIEPAEILDADGKLIGLFVPANLQEGKERYARTHQSIDQAEIERRLASEPLGRPLEDIIRDLSASTNGRRAPQSQPAASA